ncbi:MAG TPA: SAM-dependent chlorinase/fluorinase [Gemmatimonadales bacterium]|nr:SAM-dependent chlorinase/fluorinase [Gemmatimonadales bacterium]
MRSNLTMPIITLLTDYGISDAYVGELKAVLLTGAPGATLVDITHQISPGDIAAGAYVLGRAAPRFPAGTIHLAVVDPGVGTSRAALALSSGGHIFVGPDNGLFSAVIRGAEVEAVTLATPSFASPTFHGRDLFAPAAARLAQGEALAALGERYAGMPRRVSGAVPHYEGKVVVGEVIYVDRYGNLVTNLTPDLVPSYAVLEAESLVIGPVRSTFGDVPSGSLLAYIGSGGSVEIAVRDGSAARRLGIGVGGRIRARLG